MLPDATKDVLRADGNREFSTIASLLFSRQVCSAAFLVRQFYYSCDDSPSLRDSAWPQAESLLSFVGDKDTCPRDIPKTFRAALGVATYVFQAPLPQGEGVTAV